MLVDHRVTVSISHAFAILNDFLMIFPQNMDVFENGVHPQRAISIGKSMLKSHGNWGFHQNPMILNWSSCIR